jgi:hypothetical protein
VAIAKVAVRSPPPVARAIRADDSATRDAIRTGTAVTFRQRETRPFHLI